MKKEEKEDCTTKSKCKMHAANYTYTHTFVRRQNRQPKLKLEESLQIVQRA